jgi:predicted neuraminidase
MPSLSPDEIAARMDGRLRPADDGRLAALLPSPSVQNHAAFLSWRRGSLDCLWFGGSLEGKSDIAIQRATLGDHGWGAVEQLTDDPDLSEQNPVQLVTPRGALLFHTAQPGGDQDACVIRMRKAGAAPTDLALPRGTFIRGPIHVRSDGAWLLPLFRCVSRPGQRWTGSHDTAALGISSDGGASWRQIDVPLSIGCVHMALVPAGGDRFLAFFRRRQADLVHRSESVDGGESWSMPAPTDLPSNNSSISAIRLGDGRIAVACNPVNAAMHADRRASLYDELGDDPRPNATGGCSPIWGVARAPMAICVSGDDGLTFPRRRVVDDGPGTCLSNDSLDGRNRELSYPSLLERGDGTLDLAYTYHRRAIKHVRLSLDWLDGQA